MNRILPLELLNDVYVSRNVERGTIHSSFCFRMSSEADSLRRSKRNKFHLDVVSMHLVHPERRRTQPVCRTIFSQNLLGFSLFQGSSYTVAGLACSSCIITQSFSARKSWTIWREIAKSSTTSCKECKLCFRRFGWWCKLLC